MNRLFLFFLILALAITGCENNKITEETADPDGKPEPFRLQEPAKFPPMQVPADNLISLEGVTLGKKLFFDPLLSLDGSKSCATCHQPENAFTSANNAANTSGFEIMPHINLGWDNKFLWNGEVEGQLEDIMRFEVAEFFRTDLNKLNNHPEYPDLFRQAFGSREITYDRMAKALAQYERTLISGNSKFDRFQRKEVMLDEQEYRGFYLFFSEDGDCFHCHGTILFKDNLYHNNGLNDTFEGNDQGRFLITGDSSDLGRFKTPTLRNIAFTAPYMHDGRFQTLKEVIDFYSNQVKFTRFTDPLMNHEGGIELSESEKDDLIAFLYTLTDSSFISNPEFIPAP